MNRCKVGAQKTINKKRYKIKINFQARCRENDVSFYTTPSGMCFNNITIVNDNRK